MTSPGSLGAQVPEVPGAGVARRVRDMQRSAQEQAAARILDASTIGNGGVLTCNGSLIINGSLTVPAGALNTAFAITAGTSVSAGTTVTAGTSLNGNSLAIIAGATVGGTLSAGAVSASGAVSGGSGTFSSSLSSPGAYGTDVSALPGARQTVWQHNSGVYGFAPSTIEAKSNIGPVPFTAADVRAVLPHTFQYKSQLAIRDDPENAFYNRDYVVPWEIGLMAEELIAHNMSMFVFFEDDGATPKGINYDLFGAVAPLVVLADQESRLRAAGI